MQGSRMETTKRRQVELLNSLRPRLLAPIVIVPCCLPALPLPLYMSQHAGQYCTHLCDILYFDVSYSIDDSLYDIHDDDAVVHLLLTVRVAAYTRNDIQIQHPYRPPVPWHQSRRHLLDLRIITVQLENHKTLLFKLRPDCNGVIRLSRGAEDTLSQEPFASVTYDTRCHRESASLIPTTGILS